MHSLEGTLFGMMWTVFSVYASVGMVLFGGKITTNSTQLIGSEFAIADYYSNNFNDFASSLVTLFEVRKFLFWLLLLIVFFYFPSQNGRQFLAWRPEDQT
jgi:hypothetical protein